MERVENQEIYCHNCGRYVQFPVDLSLDGNHVLNCPNCNHEHCRVIKKGVITDDRWAQRNGPTYIIRASVISTTATATSSGSYTWSSFGSASTGNIYYGTTAV